ncbi:MAG: hypothetical protein ACI4UM_03705 [Succinivibrio sp.]
MKLFVSLIICVIMSCTCSSAGAAGNSCSIKFRPKTNETAFAAVGSSLVIADRTCFDNVLIIPFDTRSGAVTIPKGEYPSIGQKDSKVLFSVNSSSGESVQSCLFCDPVLHLQIDRNEPKTLCVLSVLHIQSCAKENSISYTVTQKSSTLHNQCTPSLVYYGRSGNILKFAVNDCSAVSRPTLTYDMNFGRIIRFLDDRYLILNADNQGIYYRRMEKSELSSNDIIEDANDFALSDSKSNTQDKKDIHDLNGLNAMISSE